jgi:hypothetical protein
MDLTELTAALAGALSELVEIRPTGVALDSSEGQVLIPAKTFSESVSVLVEE